MTRPLTASQAACKQAIDQLDHDELLRVVNALRNHANGLRLDQAQLPPALRELLKTNRLEFLGGSNSLNFQIIPADGSKPYILKIENRLGNPKMAEQLLRADPRIQSQFAAVDADQEVTFSNGAKRYLQMTEFCTAGNLEDVSKKYMNNEALKADMAASLFYQMARFISIAQQHNIAHFDLKITNFLYNGEGNLMVADTKAFIPMQEDGSVSITEVAKQGYAIASTPDLNPKELAAHLAGKGGPVVAEQVHAFMVGKNIYEFLTGEITDEFFNNNSQSFLDAVFKRDRAWSDRHREPFKKLIQALVKEPASERMPLSNLMLELEKLIVKQDQQALQSGNLHRMSSVCRNYLNFIESTDLNPQEDSIIRSYIDTMAARLEACVQARDGSAIRNLASALKSDLNNLREHGWTEGLDQILIEQSNQYADSENINDLEKLARHYLTAIQSTQFGDKDQEMQHYTSAMSERIREQQETADLGGMKTLIEELQNDLQALRGPQVQTVKETIATQREKSSALSIGRNKKANEIEQRMGTVPIKERHAVLEGESASQKALQEALYKGRFSGAQNSSKHNEFKAKLADIKAKDRDSSPAPDPESPSLK